MLKIEGNDFLVLYAGTIIGNFTIGLNSILLVNLKIFKKITDKVTDVISNINKNILIIVLGILIIIINFLLAIPYYKIKTAYIIVF